MNAQTVQEAAAYWAMRLGSGECGPTDRAAFEAWRAENPAHAESYARAERALAAVDSHLTHPEIMKLGQEITRATAHPHRTKTWAIAAAVVFAAVGAGVLFRFTPPVAETARNGLAPEIYETATGERSSVRLADGSTVVLNTQSRLEASFSAARRSLRLVQGQAWFEVSKENRPFVVEAGDRRIVAHGTAFDVRVDADDRVQVTLVEGRVSVDDGVSEQTFLEPGQTLVAAARHAETVGSADIERVTSWREGRLVFRNDRLIDAVEEVNRYTTAKLVVSDDPELHELRISGVFDAGRTASFLLALESGHAVSSRPLSSDRILLVR